VNRVREVFGSAHVLLPVVHPASHAEALESIRVAHAAGIKGIFLIDQGMSATEVLRLIMEVRAMYPALWVGVNLLSRQPAQGLAAALDGCEGRIDGIWSDNAEEDATEFVETRRARGWNGLYFGGTAFKYQRPVADADLGAVAANAATYMDVVCTSGAGTGIAADVRKVKMMREGLGPDHALALASGVTHENVKDYLPYVDAYLVGTGIEERFGVLDPRKVEALLRAIG
jgi:predicted TIM-barrel enzyme